MYDHMLNKKINTEEITCSIQSLRANLADTLKQ